MPHTKPIRRFSKPQAGVKGLVGRYIIHVSNPIPSFFDTPTPSPRNDTVSSTGAKKDPATRKRKGKAKLNNYYLALKRGRNGKMRLINLEFKTFDEETKGAQTARTSKEPHLPPLTSTLTFSDFLCKWCLAYVGQRRQFCSADCASQFRICQKRREHRQDLNISVDYYGNVKLSIQGLPIQSGEDGSTPVQKSYPVYGGGRRGRRRKRCRNCAKLLKDNWDEDFCDETCQSMDTERSKKEDFVNIFQQKEAAERRRIRKWLMDAQDNYSKQQGELDSHGDPDLHPVITTYDWDTSSANSAKYSLPIMRNLNVLPEISSGRMHREIYNVTSGPAALDPLPVPRSPIIIPDYTRPPKDSPSRSGGPSYGHTRAAHYVQDQSRIKRDEMITGGPVTLNPVPLRRVPLKPDRPRNLGSNSLTHSYDSDKRQVMIDLKWIPKFYGQQ